VKRISVYSLDEFQCFILIFSFEPILNRRIMRRNLRYFKQSDVLSEIWKHKNLAVFGGFYFHP